MLPHCWLTLAFAIPSLYTPVPHVWACCPTPPSGRPVVNADQTVVIVWDAATKTEHFIRRASFKAEADDFGFLVPTPTQPDLNESGDGVFPILAAVTAPRVTRVARPSGGGGCGCAMDGAGVVTAAAKVTVLDEKVVAGLHAVVLEARSGEDLVDWLKANGYAFSPEVRDWAKPYVEQGWKITALKVAKAASGGDPLSTAPAATTVAGRDVSATALRMSFKTDRPLFPYREPDSTAAAQALGASRRTLRIYFIAEARYEGGLTPVAKWTGQAAWAGRVPAADRTRALTQLQLSDAGGPAEWWLTEFEDNWPYRPASADVYFTRAADQSMIERPPIVQYSAVTPNSVTGAAFISAVAAVGISPWFHRKIRPRPRRAQVQP